MNIYFNRFFNHGISFFKEIEVPVLSAQHKKILIVASIAFGLLAIYYIRSHCKIIDSGLNEQANPPSEPNNEDIRAYINIP